MQYPANQTCCTTNPAVTGWCYSGCGQTMPIVPGSNPALNYWNGQNFVISDGSSQNPISLPNLQTNSSVPSYVLGVNNSGQWFYYPYATPTNVANLSGGQAGDVPWQSAPSITSFVSAGDYNEVFVSGGSGSPFWTPQSSINAGTAITSTNLQGGGAGYIPYQSGIGTTSFLASGIPGYVLTSNGTSPPTWQYITESGTAGAITGGSAGQVVYQSGTSVTSFTSTGVAGQVLSSNGTSAPTWINQSQINSGSAINLSGGTASQMPYQTGSGATSFIPNGTSGYVLTSNGTSAPSWQPAASGSYVQSNGTVNAIVQLTQAQYNALTPPVATTLYIIIG